MYNKVAARVKTEKNLIAVFLYLVNKNDQLLLCSEMKKKNLGNSFGTLT